jgi:alpha-L-arabinofuranosidase
MKHLSVLAALCIFSFAAAVPPLVHAQTAPPISPTVRINAADPGIRLSPDFYGLMTEEINHAFDGGLYAELIQNRNFKMDPASPVHWSVAPSETDNAQIALSSADPVSAALSRSLELTIKQASKAQPAGVANDGYWGIPVKPKVSYRASFFAESEAGLKGPLTVSLESADGLTVFAKSKVPNISNIWKQYTVVLTTGNNPASTANRFAIYCESPGTLRLSQVSLFPPTYNGRPNGARVDLMEKLAALKPAFLRMPGGNYLDPGHFIWKNTIGPLTDRPGSAGAWRYQLTQGLGLLEMLEWCEDLHMTPLLAVTDGRSWLAPDADVDPLVQDALDEIEYITGPINSVWGHRRAEDGHPAPFPLKYVEIGNEDFFDKQSVYDARFAKFYDAIKSKYPHLLIIATRKDLTSRVPDVVDEHYYLSAHAMEAGSVKYDSYPRSGPKIFVGEWASKEGSPTPTFAAAIGDASWLTGLERNADIVSMESYAPLFVNVNPRASQWSTNLIGYDALSSFGSPSYYVQALFSNNHGDIELPTAVTAPTGPPPPAPSGGVGVGAWNTQAEFKDATVTNNGATLAPTDASNSFAGWTSVSGDWTLANNTLTQSGTGMLSSYIMPHSDWTNYTFEVQAQKISGAEGFLIMFHVKDSKNMMWWDIGGRKNTISQLQRTSDGTTDGIGRRISQSIDTGRWYDIKVVASGRDIKCYLDNLLVAEETEAPQAPVSPIFASSSRDTTTGDIYLHLVNAANSAQAVNLTLEGVSKVEPQADGQILTGNPADQNSIEDPTRIAPQPISISNAGKSFIYTAAPSSVSVIRLRTK